MPKYKKGFYSPLLIILIALSFIFTVSLIFFGFKSFSGKNTPELNNGKPNAELVNAPVITNPEYGQKTLDESVYQEDNFQITLPKDWYIYKNSLETRFQNYSLPQDTKSDGSVKPTPGHIRFSIFRKETTLDLDSFASEIKASYERDYGGDTWSQENIIINGEKTIKAQTRPNYLQTNYLIAQPGKNLIYRIIFSGDFENNKTLEEKIINSFKFL